MEHLERNIAVESPEASTVSALMLTQYRTSKMEEIVTRNVFRLIWFMFCIYVSSSEIGVDNSGIDQHPSPLLLYAEPVGILLASGALLVISSRVMSYIHREAIILKEMLVSLDVQLKNYYVEELYKEQVKLGRSRFGEALARFENIMWVFAVMTILAVRVFVAIMN